ncbi:MAG: hypothetical protein KatS3mg114_1117 [Planctomycetaceae bacterium]|nr:MAG: hypothetical protein KatS3mg114_1117 [Planctomycetaceae bacterium]
MISLAGEAFLCRLFLLLVLQTGRDEMAAQEEFSYAQQLYRLKRWTPAAESFQRYLQQHPQGDRAPEAWLYLGICYEYQQQYPRAIECLQTFLKRYPRHELIPQVRFRLAESYYLAGEWKTAEQELTKLLALQLAESQAAAVRLYLGRCYLQLRQTREAEQIFQELVQRYGHTRQAAEAKLALAQTWLDTQQVERATTLLQELAREQDATAAEALLMLARHEVQTNHHEQALSLCADFLQRFPDNEHRAEILYLKALALYRTKQFVAAAETFDLAARDDTARDPVWIINSRIGMAWAYRGQQEHSRAADILRSMLDDPAAKPHIDRIIFYLAQCEQSVGQIADSIARYLQLAQDYPLSEWADDALYHAWDLMLQQGKVEPALALTQRFAPLIQQSSLRLHFDLLKGRTLLQKAESVEPAQRPMMWREASQLFERVASQSENLVARCWSWFYLAEIAQKRDAPAQALAHLKQVEAHLPQVPELVESLLVQADCLLQLHDATGAMEILERYIQHQPAGRQLARAWQRLVRAALEAGDLQRAEQALDRLDRDFKDSSARDWAQLEFADHAKHAQNWAEAAQRYTKLSEDAHDAEVQRLALKGRALCLLQLSRPDEAWPLWKSLLETASDDAERWEARFFAGMSQKLLDQAQQALETWQPLLQQEIPSEVQSLPTPPAPWNFVMLSAWETARVLSSQQQVDQANTAYEQLLTRFPQSQLKDQWLAEWGYMNVSAGRWDQADMIFARLLQETPQSRWAWWARLSRAEHALEQTDPQSALQILEQLHADPEAPDEVRQRAGYQLVIFHLARKHWSQVITWTQRYQTAFPNSPHAQYLEYCELEARVASIPRAEEIPELLARILRLQEHATDSPWRPRLWLLRAELYLQLKQYADVLATVENFQTTFTTDHEVYPLLTEVAGRANKQQALFDQARQLFELTITHPRTKGTETAAKAQFLLAETWLLQEKWEQAFLAYQKVVALYPFPHWQALALQQSARCEEQQGHWAQAVEIYQQLLDDYAQHVAEADIKQRQAQAARKASTRGRPSQP